VQPASAKDEDEDSAARALYSELGFLCADGNVERGLEVYEAIKKRGLPLRPALYDRTLYLLSLRNEPEPFIKLFAEVKEKNLLREAHFSLLVGCLARAGRIDDAIAVRARV
jgi:hypothetical protein